MSPSSSREKFEDLLRQIDELPFRRFLGLKVSMEGDAFTCIMPFRPMLIGNPMLPALHGGAIGGFLECTGLFYLMYRTARGKPAKTINLDVNYLRSGQPADTYANAEIVRLGRRIANLRIFAWQTDRAQPIAMGNGNFMLSPG